MLGYFYNKSIRKYIILMSNLFSNIQVQRDGRYIQVPINYASKERFMAKLQHMDKDNHAATARIETILPRISLNMVNMTYDSSRQINVSNRKTQADYSKDRPSLNTQFTPVAYDFDFELGIYTRHQDDMFQIVEQILPYFRPHFTCMMKELDEKELVIDNRDIPIVLDSVEMSEELEGPAGDRRRIEWNMNFRLKGWLYPSADSQAGQIRTIYLNFNSEEKEMVKIEAPKDELSQNIGIDYSIYKSIEEASELMYDTRESMEQVYPHGWDIRTDTEQNNETSWDVE